MNPTARPRLLDLLPALLLPGLLAPGLLATACSDPTPAEPTPDATPTDTCAPPATTCGEDCLPPCPADMARDAVDCACWASADVTPTGSVDVADTLCLSKTLSGGTSESAVKRRQWMFGALKHMGITRLRSHFLWHSLEKKKGEFNWASSDLKVAEAKANGIELIGLLAYGNPWASKEGAEKKDHHYPPDDPADFANYAGALAKRFKADVHRWEVWNEQNSGFRFWKGTGSLGGDPKAYGALLRATHTAVKAQDPNAQVGYGGLFYLPQIIPGAETFTDASFAAWPDLGDHFEAFAWHPYAPYPPIAAPEDAGDPDSDVLQPVPADETARRLVKTLAKHNKTGAHLWVTELGWPTEKAVTETEAAAFLVRSYVLLLSEGVELLCWYTLMDSHPDHKAIAFWEKVFGLYQWADVAKGEVPVAKPAVPAHRTLWQQLGPLRWAANHSRQEGDDATRPARHHVFAAAGKATVHVLWDPKLAVDKTSAATIPAQKGASYTTITMLGEAGKATITDENLVQVEVGGAPIYVLATPAQP